MNAGRHLVFKWCSYGSVPFSHLDTGHYHCCIQHCPVVKIPPRGVELPHSNTANNEKSIERGAESGADQPQTDELVDLLDSMTPEQREALIALIRTKK